MYKQYKRWSVYLSWKKFWLRHRTKDMMPKGFFMSMGVEK